MSGDKLENAARIRRKIIFGATTSLLAIGLAASLWPMIDQMNPGASAMREELEVDLAPIQAGQAITVRWSGKPIFIRHRTPEQIREARIAPLSALRDFDARIMKTFSELALASAEQLPATDANRTKPGKENWLLVVGLCTHESCTLNGNSPHDARGDFGGWLCPCCASHYDTSGRLRAGPGPFNLAVPPYRFTRATSLVIG